MTLFEKKVYEVVRKIPRGKVMTYQAVAKAIGKPQAFRAVGNALNKNPFAPRVPCHRVIAASGRLGGYAKGLKKKIGILEREGLKIRKGKIDLEKFGWKIKNRLF